MITCSKIDDLRSRSMCVCVFAYLVMNKWPHCNLITFVVPHSFFFFTISFLFSAKGFFSQFGLLLDSFDVLDFKWTRSPVTCNGASQFSFSPLN
jgi:hypothetical protein